MSATPFRPLPWQASAWRRLADARAQGRLAHAWIFSGPRGVGKKHFAGAFAASLLCSDPRSETYACGTCERCKVLAAGGHPDAHLLSRDGHLGLALTPTLQREDGITHWEPKGESKRKEIAIGAVRSLIEDKLPLAAHFGGARITVIAPAESLNTSSADALLKTIEEPRLGTTLILIAEQALSLSATLRSRCQQIRLGLPAREDALAWLADEMPESNAMQRGIALESARGAPLAAAEQLASGTAPEAERWHAELEEFRQGRGDPLKLASSVDDEHTVPFLHAAQIWLTAKLRAESRSKPTARNPLLIRAESLAAELVEAHRRLESNVKGQLVLEALLIAWRRWLAPSASASSESGMMNMNLQR